jgi:hypothetical protein
MTIDKAIEILHLDSLGDFDGDPADLAEAEQFGIEALQRITDMRKYKTLVGLAASCPARALGVEVA